MLRVSTSSARAGMTVAQPVYHPLCPGHVLLKPGAELDEPGLERLREYRVGMIWVRYPALDFLARYVSPAVAGEHARVASLLSDGFDAVSTGAHAPLNFGAYAGAVGSLLRQFVDAPQAALYVQDMVGTARPLLAHGTTV